MAGIPARVLFHRSSKGARFEAYGTPSPEMPDLAEHAVAELRRLRERLTELEAQLEESRAGSNTSPAAPAAPAASAAPAAPAAPAANEAQGPTPVKRRA